MKAKETIELVEKMGQVDNQSYIFTSGWMVNELKLKGFELQVFAIIYSFSEYGQRPIILTAKEMMAWTGSSRKTVSKAIQSLMKKGFIKKRTFAVNGVKFNDYRVSDNTLCRINKYRFRKNW